MDRLEAKDRVSAGREPEVLIIKAARWRRIGSLISSGLIALVFAIPTALWIWLPSSTGEGALETSGLSQFINLLVDGATLLHLAMGLVCVGYAFKNIWWGDRLTLSSEGLRYRLGKQVGFVSWHDIKQFRLEAPLLGMAEMVGWDYLDDRAENPSQWRRLRTAGEHATSLHGDLGYRWQGGSCQVRDTLESWRLRHTVDAGPVIAKDRSSVEPCTDTLIIGSAVWKDALPLLLLAGSLILFVWLSAWLILQSRPDKPMQWLLLMVPGLMGVGFLGPLLWVYLRRLIARPRLILRAEGFELIDEQGSLFTTWHAVEVFGLIHDAQSHRSYVGWRSKSDRLAHPYSAEMDQSLGAGFVVSPHDLRDMLEDWRILHSQPGG